MARFVIVRYTSIHTYTLNTCVVIVRVRTGPGKPGKSWNFTLAFSRSGKSWKRTTGPGKC